MSKYAQEAADNFRAGTKVGKRYGGGRCSYTSTSFYSYSTVIGRKIDGYLFVRRNEWGPTTGSHLQALRRSFHSVVEVPGKLGYTTAENLAIIWDHATQCLVDLKGRRLTAALVTEIKEHLATRQWCRSESPDQFNEISDYLKISHAFTALDAWEAAEAIRQAQGEVVTHNDYTLTAKVNGCKVKWSLDKILVNGAELARDLFDAFITRDVRRALATAN